MDSPPTFAQLVGTELPVEVDGISMLPTLLGRPAERATSPLNIRGSRANRRDHA